MKKYDYPILNKITSIFNKLERCDLKNTYICACQHILEPQKEMFRLISSFGVPKNNIHILGKIYSTNFEVLKELTIAGYHAQQPTFDLTQSFDIQHEKNCQSLFLSFIKNIPKNSHVIIVDDGAELINIYRKYKAKVSDTIKIIAIEQTSSGFRKLENEKLDFPVINVARSPIKLDNESPLIARLGSDRINEVIEKYKIITPRILVIGLGPMGNNVLQILDEEGYFTLGHDTIFNSNTEILDLVIEKKINIIIGATGTNIITEQQILKLNQTTINEIYLISMSSSDREFPSNYIRNNTELVGSVHDDAHWDKIFLINNGFPITFKGKRYESTPIEIEKTIGLLYGSVLYANTHKINTTGLIDVPKIVTDII